MQVSRAFSCFGVPRGRPMPPAHCIPAAGPAPGRPVSQCYGFPRSRFPGSATSCAALCLGLPPRTRLWRSRARVHSKVVDASCPIVAGLDSTAAGAFPQPGLVAERCELKPKSKTNTKSKEKQARWTAGQSALSIPSQGPRPHWFLSPWSPCSHLAGARVPGSRGRPQQRVVKEEVAGSFRGP